MLKFSTKNESGYKVYGITRLSSRWFVRGVEPKTVMSSYTKHNVTEHTCMASVCHIPNLPTS